MKTAINHWQGLGAGLAAIALFFIDQHLIPILDPGAGISDGGVIHWINLAAVVYLVGIFITGLGWQIAFRSMDKWADNHLKEAFDSFTPKQQWLAVQATYILMWIGWFLAIYIVPKG